MRNTIEDMKYMYIKFHSEIARIAEYFADDNFAKGGTLMKEKSMTLRGNTFLQSSPVNANSK